MNNSEMKCYEITKLILKINNIFHINYLLLLQNLIARSQNKPETERKIFKYLIV